MSLVFHDIASRDKALPWPLVLAHFLPWFTVRGSDYPLALEEEQVLGWIPHIEDMRHWNDARAGYRRTHLRMPLPGVYDSRDPELIRWQIETAIAHGIRGFVINWYGKHSVENVITLHWLRGLARWNAEYPDRPFHYFLCHDMQAQWPTEGKQPVSLEEDFVFIRDYLIRPGYLCRNGRPLVAVFPYADARARYRCVLDGVFAETGADLIWCGEALGAGEDAAFVWVAPDAESIRASDEYPWSDPNNCGIEFLRRFYAREKNPADACRYLMAGVWPGFNDGLVRWAWNAPSAHAKLRPRVICRHTREGCTLERTWDAYVDSVRAFLSDDRRARLPAPLVQLITWNDYAEDTVLEPTRDDGSKPLEICSIKRREAERLFAASDRSGEEMRDALRP